MKRNKNKTKIQEKKLLNKKTKRTKKIKRAKNKDNKNSKKANIQNKNCKIMSKDIKKIDKDLSLTNNKKQSLNLITEFKTAPKEIKYSASLIKNVDHGSSFSENVFLLFKSVNNIYYLIYTNDNCSIILYDVLSNSKVNEIKGSRDDTINCFNHYQDAYNKRDLIMSINAGNNSIKVWNINDFTLLHDFQEINKNGYLNTACFLNYVGNIYIITSNHRYSSKNIEPIKIYDLNGNKIKDLKDSNENVCFLDSYYDKKLNKKLILAGFNRYIKSYDYENNTTYKVYKDKYRAFHRNVIIKDNEEITKLIESSSDSFIRIWDFHKGELIKKIYVDIIGKYGQKGVYGICIWSSEYLFAGINNKILLIDLNTEKIISKLDYGCYNPNCLCNYEDVISIKKINHPKFGECLITKAKYDPKIKIWTNKK